MLKAVIRKLGMPAVSILLTLCISATAAFVGTDKLGAGYWNGGNYRLNSWETREMANWNGSLSGLTEGANSALGAYAAFRGYPVAGLVIGFASFLYYGTLNYWKWVASHVRGGNCLTINYTGFAFIERCT